MYAGKTEKQWLAAAAKHAGIEATTGVNQAIWKTRIGGIGAKLWFGLMILGQWIMFIEYATKPITRYNSAYQQATVIYGIVGIVGTALYLWLAIGKRKAPLVTIMASVASMCCPG